MISMELRIAFAIQIGFAFKINVYSLFDLADFNRIRIVENTVKFPWNKYDCWKLSCRCYLYCEAFCLLTKEITATNILQSSIHQNG